MYHGSPDSSFVPTYGIGRDDNDFGRGFYLTPDPDLAKEWTVGLLVDTDVGYMHTYTLDTSRLKILDFEAHNICAWLSEIMYHRKNDGEDWYVYQKRDADHFIEKYKIDTSGYDVLRGWRADISYGHLFKAFVENVADTDTVCKIPNLGEFGIQYCLKSDKFFDCITELTERLERADSDTFKPLYRKRDLETLELIHTVILRTPRDHEKIFPVLASDN